MQRRRVLALCGLGVSGLPGCLAQVPIQSSEPTGTPQVTPTDEGGGETPDGDDIEVTDPVVKKAVRYESIMGSGGVLTEADRQYVVATVRPSGAVSSADLSFRTDEMSWNPGLPDTAGGTTYAVAGHGGGPVGRSLDAEGGESYLAFTVPSPLSASNPRIRYDGADTREWPLTAAQRDRLAAAPPEFELDSLDVPETVTQGETLSVEMTVRNVSDTGGRFLAAVYWPTKRIADDDESHVLQRVLTPGEDATASIDIDTANTTRQSEAVTLSIRGHVSAEREVEVR